MKSIPHLKLWSVAYIWMFKINFHSFALKYSGNVVMHISRLSDLRLPPVSAADKYESSVRHILYSRPFWICRLVWQYFNLNHILKHDNLKTYEFIFHCGCYTNILSSNVSYFVISNVCVVRKDWFLIHGYLCPSSTMALSTTLIVIACTVLSTSSTHLPTTLG